MELNKKFNCSISFFFSFMERLIARNSIVWKKDNKYIKVSYANGNLNQHVWNLNLFFENNNEENKLIMNGRAAIFSIQIDENIISIDFIDGRTYPKPNERPTIQEALNALPISPLPKIYFSDNWKSVSPIGTILQEVANILFDEFDIFISKQGYINPDNSQIKIMKPDENQDLDTWFEYYHGCKQNRIKYTLRELAEDANYSYSYVRRKHGEFMHRYSKS